MGSVTSANENLKDQVRVLAPELELSLFSLDNIVENGKIVPAPDEDDDDADPPPVHPPRLLLPQLFQLLQLRSATLSRILLFKS